MAKLNKTAEQIREMPAGAEMDRWIFDNIMGGIPSSMQHPEAYWDGFYKLGGHGHYSTNIAHAWEVVDRLHHRFHMRVRIESPIKMGEPAPLTYVRFGSDDGRATGGSGDSAPLAICRAALLSLAVEVKGEVGLC